MNNYKLPHQQVFNNIPAHPHFESNVIKVPLSDLEESSNVISFKNKVKGKEKHSLLWDSQGRLLIMRSLADRTTKQILGPYIFRSILDFIPLDIAGNGFNDVVVIGTRPGTYASDTLMSKADILWLENPGTSNDKWSPRLIGSFPGLNYLKVGHFTSNYSLQLLVLAKSDDTSVPSSLFIFTRPQDFRSAPSWLVTRVREFQFRAIKDCVVVPADKGSMDNIVISSEEGLSVLWYDQQEWHCERVKAMDGTDSIEGVGKRSLLSKGALCKEITLLVTAEDNGTGPLIAYVNAPECLRFYFPPMPSKRIILDEFNVPTNANTNTVTIKDIVCADMDGDGVDEILVSVDCEDSRKGVYYYDLNDCDFAKYKVYDEAVEKITPGLFISENPFLDFVSLSTGSPSTLRLHSSSFVTSPVTASLPSDPHSGLRIQIPRPTELAIPYETDLLSIQRFTYSLLILPPNGAYTISSRTNDPFSIYSESESDAYTNSCYNDNTYIKVLDGTLAWVDSYDSIVERTRVTARPGSSASLIVDAPEGVIRSGGEGCVCLRARADTTAVGFSVLLEEEKKRKARQQQQLRVWSALPKWVEWEVGEWAFMWRRVKREGWFKEQSGMRAEVAPADLYHLPAFTISYAPPALQTSPTSSGQRLRENLPTMSTPASTSTTTEPTPLAYIHFWACAPGTSTDYHRHNLSPTSSPLKPTASVKICLSNPTGESGVNVVGSEVGAWDAGRRGGEIISPVDPLGGWVFSRMWGDLGVDARGNGSRKRMRDGSFKHGGTSAVTDTATFRRAYRSGARCEHDHGRDSTEPQSKKISIPEMHELGPIWDYNSSTRPSGETSDGDNGESRSQDNGGGGAVTYPWHSWVSGPRRPYRPRPNRLSIGTQNPLPEEDGTLPEPERWDMWMEIDFFTPFSPTTSTSTNTPTDARANQATATDIATSFLRRTRKRRRCDVNKSFPHECIIC